MQIENSNLRKQLHKEISFSDPRTGNVKGYKKQTRNAVDFKLLQEKCLIPFFTAGLPGSAIANTDSSCITTSLMWGL